MVKTGEDWDGLHLGKFEKRQIYVSLYQNIIYTVGKSFSVVMWPWFCKWKTLALPIWRGRAHDWQNLTKLPKIAWPGPLWGGRTQFPSADAWFTITFKLFMLWCPFFARVKVNYRSIYSRILARVCTVAMATGLVKNKAWKMVFVHLK